MHSCCMWAPGHNLIGAACVAVLEVLLAVEVFSRCQNQLLQHADRVLVLTAGWVAVRSSRVLPSVTPAEGTGHCAC